MEGLVVNTALVTGATGIVGSWLVQELLTLGVKVVALVLDEDPGSELIRTGAISGARVVNGRLENIRDIERAMLVHDVDTVFHLGAQTLVEAALRSPRMTFEANILGTWNVLDASRLHGVRRVVVASSDKAYGNTNGVPYTETVPLQGSGPYDVSKSCADLIAQSYAATYGLDVTIARCGNVYGGGDLNWSRLVPGTIRSLLRDEAPVLRSDGHMIRDYLYVKDAVRAYLALATAEVRGEAFNFSTGEGHSVFDIVDRLRLLMGRQHLAPVIKNTAKAEIPVQILDSRKARERLGWKPEYDLDTGLRNTIAWYEAYLR